MASVRPCSVHHFFSHSRPFTAISRFPSFVVGFFFCSCSCCSFSRGDDGPPVANAAADCGDSWLIFFFSSSVGWCRLCAATGSSGGGGVCCSDDVGCASADEAIAAVLLLAGVAVVVDEKEKKAVVKEFKEVSMATAEGSMDEKLVFETVDFGDGLRLQKVVSSGAEFIEQRAPNLAKVINTNKTDIVPGQYEGGFKLWECARDFVRFVHTGPATNTPRCWLTGKRVLEVGCGHGLPGITALLGGAACVHFSDYNEEVLQHSTIPNILRNCSSSSSPSASPVIINSSSQVRLFSGDWAALADHLKQHQHQQYDVILSTDTVYSLESIQSLLRLIHVALRPQSAGVAYVMGRCYYFGVGGGTKELVWKAQAMGFITNRVAHFPAGVERDIISLTLPLPPPPPV